MLDSPIVYRRYPAHAHALIVAGVLCWVLSFVWVYFDFPMSWYAPRRVPAADRAAARAVPSSWDEAHSSIASGLRVAPALAIAFAGLVAVIPGVSSLDDGQPKLTLDRAGILDHRAAGGAVLSRWD